MVIFSKCNSSETKIEDTRPIMVMSHMTKIFEKCILDKLETLNSKLLEIQNYSQLSKTQSQLSRIYVI